MSTSIGDAFLGKVPPHSKEAELSVIGGVLLHNKTVDVVSDIVRPQDFYSEAHELIFQAILDLHIAHQSIDLITLGEILKQRGELESVGGLAYLSSILDNVPTAAHIESHAKVVAEKASVRSCLGAALDILQKGYGEYGDAETYLDESEQSLFEATRRRSKVQVQDIYTAIKKTFGDLERLQEFKSEVTGVPTGYSGIDQLTTGLQPSDLIIVAGRPSMGKTSLALNMATNAAKTAGTGVIIFSLEMSISQLMMRLFSAEASVPSSRIRVPRYLSQEDFTKISEVAGTFYKAPIYLDDSAELNVLEIRSRARRLKAKVDLGLIIVDYLQIMRPVQRSRGDASREREIAEITRSLKALAKELEVPVVCLSQLNRGPENRSDHRPQLSDLRESGAIEQDADLIIFLYRDAAYNHDSDDNTAEVIVGKNRNGPTGVVRLVFQKEYTRFDNMERAQESASQRYGDMLNTPPPDDAPMPDDEDEPPPF